MSTSKTVVGPQPHNAGKADASNTPTRAKPSRHATQRLCAMPPPPCRAAQAWCRMPSPLYARWLSVSAQPAHTSKPVGDKAAAGGKNKAAKPSATASASNTAATHTARHEWQ